MITIKTIVQKITSNKMILFGILGAYFGIPGLGLVITSILDKDMGLLAPGVFFLLPALVLWFFFFKAAQTRRDIKRNGEIQRKPPHSSDRTVRPQAASTGRGLYKPKARYQCPTSSFIFTNG